MPTSRERSLRYQRRLEEILRQAQRIDDKTAKTLMTRLIRLRGDLLEAVARAKVGEWGTKMAISHFRQLIRRIEEVLSVFAEDWTRDAMDSLESMLEHGRMAVVDPINAAGYMRFRLRSTMAEMALLFDDVPTRIAGVTQSALAEITRRLRGELMGIESEVSFTDWLESYLSQQPERQTSRFGPLPYQAERIWRTESMHTLNNGQRLGLRELDKTAPGWVKDHMRKWWKHGLVGRQHPREAHVRAEQITRANPLRLDEQFSINGNLCDGPHDPTLPASESIFCGCTLITTVVGV